MSERGLGRGLGALIPRVPSVGLREVPVDAIRPNPWQPRTHFDETELDELAQSIREHGVLQPVLVSQQQDGTYQLITGERRWRAVKKAGLQTVPAMLKEATPQASLELALVENIQRRDLNPLEEAAAFRALLDEHGLTQEQLGQRIGKSRVAITNTLRLLNLPEEVREALAREMNAARSRESAPAPLDPDVERLEDAFRQALGTRVRLVKGRRGGRLVITFFSDDELQGLYERLVQSD